ncbi:D-alanyl-D-alanine carboxypeptidase family protein [Aureimonas pseudogalii]|uniref:D-alanyl-D-alanine carboxypeptidase n=1 Tax=Aureimonas pseudogalii TaxID=1744844 RepID=A0A7W6ML00_9HYPH|nr:D-alanyl-D-alanine carboxypeptidase family protein [Aureimonas pseudogalii]MBB3999359.1 D-alanyl-D-alanine carboxypeptidase [Aureimonas pseudogalii]
MTTTRRDARVRSLMARGLILFGLLAVATPASALNTIAVDVATGKVLSQHNATQRWYPASTTKLMTAYVTLKALQAGEVAPDTPVVMTRAATAQAPSKMGYKPGSVMRLDMALRMMLVKSANDVAYAIAQTLGDGSLETFVGRMNADAAALQMLDTHFVNPNGLPQDGQYSSAKDLAILGTAIRREFPTYADYFSTEAIVVGQGIMKNGNGLLGRYRGADGMKTGYICASGFNLVASATRDGRTIVAVVLGAEGPIVRERAAAEVIENGFNTNPRSIRDVVTDLPPSAGPPADVSAEICSPAGRTARANERETEDKREETFGSPYMSELDRPPAAVPVSLGGAAGRGDIEPNVSLIAAYGIPLPTARPARPGEPGGPPAEAPASAAASNESAPAGAELGSELRPTQATP